MYRTRTEPRTSCLLSFLHWSQMESALNLPFRKSVRSYSQSLRPTSRFIKFSPQHKSLIVSFPQQPWGKPWPCATSARQPFLPWLCVVSLSAESMIKERLLPPHRSLGFIILSPPLYTGVCLPPRWWCLSLYLEGKEKQVCGEVLTWDSLRRRQQSRPSDSKRTHIKRDGHHV